MKMLPEVKAAYDVVENDYEASWPRETNPCGHSVYAWQLHMCALRSVGMEIEHAPVGAGSAAAVRSLITKYEEQKDYGAEYNALCAIMQKIEDNRLQS